MIAIRLFTGIIIKYPEANCLEYKSEGMHLYTKTPKDGGRWVAFVQNTCGCVIDGGDLPDMIYPPNMTLKIGK